MSWQQLLISHWGGTRSFLQLSTKSLYPTLLPNALIQRHYGKHNKKYLYKDGVKCNNIFYYPR